jgi:ribosome production factor 1
VRPTKRTFDFLKEVMETLPRCYYWERGNYSLKEICEQAPSKDYTDIMVFRENRKKLAEVIFIHLPVGPTAIFKLTSLRLRKEIFHHGNPTDHHPEVILTNFNTNVGRRMGRFF